jgi:hypothetical protein
MLIGSLPIPALHLDDPWVGYGLCAELISICYNSSRCCCRLRPLLPSMVIEHKFLSPLVTACRKRVILLLCSNKGYETRIATTFFQKDGILATFCYGIEVLYPSKCVTKSPKVQRLGSQNISIITQIHSSFKSKSIIKINLIWYVGSSAICKSTLKV